MTKKHLDELSLAEKLGLSVPLFAFSDMPEVVAEVSKAGGIGILGALMSSPEEFERRLKWLDEELGDIPYGVDIVITAGNHDNAAAASQKAAEDALRYLNPNQQRRGAIVVMDCNNGDVLALASAPTFDPNIFAGFLPASVFNPMIDPKGSPPLFNRATYGRYHPGSIFKINRRNMVDAP